MPGMIVDGKMYAIQDWMIENFIDNPKMKLSAEDGTARRTDWIRAVCLHTTQGKIARPMEGWGPDAKLDERTQLFWSGSKSSAGAHIVVDCDGSMVCTADLKRTVAYHAGSVNGVTIGIEIAQREMTNPDGTKYYPLYRNQLLRTGELVLWLCRQFRIAPQFHDVYKGHPIKRVADGGMDCVGVYGHRDQTEERGQGDPGNEIFAVLAALGFRPFNYALGEDLAFWKPIQARLAALFPDMNITVDGEAGPATDHALIRAGVAEGVMSILNGQSPKF